MHCFKTAHSVRLTLLSDFLASHETMYCCRSIALIRCSLIVKLMIFLINPQEIGVQPYRKVAVVEQFFDIIYNVHVGLGGRSGRHAGQKRTYRTVNIRLPLFFFFSLYSFHRIVYRLIFMGMN